MVSRLRSKLGQYRRIAAKGAVGPIWSDLRRWAWSDDQAVGMERDLTVAHDPPPARVPIEIVPLDDDLADRLFANDGIDAGSVLDMEARRRFWDDRLPGAFVALLDDGMPCYVQWAIPGSEAGLVKGYFGPGFPDLAPDDLLLEGAWARPEARGKRIMAEAMSRITTTAAQPHHRRALTFVGVDNEASLRGCRAAGFEVYVERSESWRLGRRRVRWGDPAAG